MKSLLFAVTHMRISSFLQISRGGLSLKSPLKIKLFMMSCLWSLTFLSHAAWDDGVHVSGQTLAQYHAFAAGQDIFSSTGVVYEADPGASTCYPKGTAVLIHPLIVITAAHVVDQWKKPSLGTGKSYFFNFNQDALAGVVKESRRVVRVIRFKDQDICLLRLEHPYESHPSCAVIASVAEDEILCKRLKNVHTQVLASRVPQLAKFAGYGTPQSLCSTWLDPSCVLRDVACVDSRQKIGGHAFDLSFDPRSEKFFSCFPTAPDSLPAEKTPSLLMLPTRGHSGAGLFVEQADGTTKLVALIKGVERPHSMSFGARQYTQYRVHYERIRLKAGRLERAIDLLLP